MSLFNIDIDEDAVMDEELVHKEIKSDIASYSSTGEIPTDSQMFNYFDSYKHKYENLIHNTSAQTEDVQQHIIDVSYERANETEIMKARAEAITIDHPGIDDRYNFMEKTYQEGRGSGKARETAIEQ